MAQLMNLGFEGSDRLPIASPLEAGAKQAHSEHHRDDRAAQQEREQKDLPECDGGELHHWQVDADGVGVAVRELPAEDQQSHEEQRPQNPSQQSHLEPD